jgi:hypothetical protein
VEKLAEYFKNFEKQRTYVGNVQETEDKPKKFVFQVYPENIDYVESLSYEEKNDLINHLLTNYKEGRYNENAFYDRAVILKYVSIIIITLILLVPIFIYFLNISLNMTESNYKIYQSGFEKLFNR